MENYYTQIPDHHITLCPCYLQQSWNTLMLYLSLEQFKNKKKKPKVTTFMENLYTRNSRSPHHIVSSLPSPILECFTVVKGELRLQTVHYYFISIINTFKRATFLQKKWDRNLLFICTIKHLESWFFFNSLQRFQCSCAETNRTKKLTDWLTDGQIHGS